jgi:hypothetical protein
VRKITNNLPKERKKERKNERKRGNEKKIER